MKNVLIAAIILLGNIAVNAQSLVNFGIKAGPNFANFNGDSEIDFNSRTSFHAGLVAEIKAFPNMSLQPELLYSSQGAKVDGMDDFNLDYVSIPVMVKYYILSDKLSLEAGPQFSFLVDERDEAWDGITGNEPDNNSFDFALAGGVGLNITQSLFAQARYTIGLTEASKDAEIQNAVFQLSLGYMF
ncbi:MAG: PorT family protein [Flavobacterium sp.]|nr:PorT family protein [Flavobacterium sp.]